MDKNLDAESPESPEFHLKPSDNNDKNTMIKRYARGFESFCCRTIRIVPRVFVHGTTTWGLWTVASISLRPGHRLLLGYWSVALEFALWFMANWSYVSAVYTDPGTTTTTNTTTSAASTTRDHSYASLPMQNPDSTAPVTATTLMVKSNGSMRFCKKCQARKPDRAHHCSTCRRCVLKMDHHCPWLTTCIGLRNYKSFLLFLIYTTLLCIFTCFASVGWLWFEVLSPDVPVSEPLGLQPVNCILLGILALSIGLVVGGFTAWHIMLATRGQTTIECLEKTRYLSPLSRSLYEGHAAGRGLARPTFGQQLIDIHANTLPGITRPEEGEERRSPSVSARPSPSSFSTYEDMERHRSRKQFEHYRDEKDSEKLPNAFDLGWRANLSHLFGRKPLLWPLPVLTTTGDGWSWPANPEWVEAHERLRRMRDEQDVRDMRAGWLPDASAATAAAYPQQGHGYYPSSASSASSAVPAAPAAPTAPVPSPASLAGPKPQSKADRVLGRDPNLYADAMLMRRLSPRGHASPRAEDGHGIENDWNSHQDGDQDENEGHDIDEERGSSRPLKTLGNPGWNGPRSGGGGASNILTRSSTSARKNPGTAEERQRLVGDDIEDGEVD